MSRRACFFCPPVSKAEKLRLKIMNGANVRFDELCHFAESVGFSKRNQKGSHAVYAREGIPEIVNFQPLPGGKAKPYQVRQLREIVLEYNL